MTARQSRDEVFAAIATAVGAVPVQWPDVPSDPLASDQWARVAMQHTDGGLAALRGETGQRKIRAQGLFTVQVFTRQGKGLANGYDLAETVKNALEDLRASTRLRRIRLQEVAARNGFSQINVIAEFEYDDQR